MTRSPRRTAYLNDRFRAAVDRFAIELRETANIQHTGIKGDSREEALRGFFTERLPRRFGVVKGEVIDREGSIGPQLDLMIYDAHADFPFAAGQDSILPAEALLASVEVKSELNASEIDKCITAARKLRSLRPYGRQLAGNDVGKTSGEKRARYLHCIFSYSTNLTGADWISDESIRVKSRMGNDHLIDAAYVLDRGVLNFNYNQGRREDDKGGAIGNLYFTILNFIVREANRRRETPYERYVTHSANAWRSL